MKKTLSSWLNEAKKLRDDSIAARTRFLLFLCEFETSDTWRDGEALASFGKFLELHKLCRAADYEEFAIARKLLDDDTIERIGPYATRQAARFRSSDNRKKFVRDAEDYREREGAAMSEQHAKHQKLQYEPDTGYQSLPERKNSWRTDRINELESVVKTQRERIRTLEHEIADLRKELTKAAKKPKTSSKAKAVATA
jgi:hypothetical protein